MRFAFLQWRCAYRCGLSDNMVIHGRLQPRKPRVQGECQPFSSEQVNISVTCMAKIYAKRGNCVCNCFSNAFGNLKQGKVCSARMGVTFEQSLGIADSFWGKEAIWNLIRSTKEMLSHGAKRGPGWSRLTCSIRRQSTRHYGDGEGHTNYSYLKTMIHTGIYSYLPCVCRREGSDHKHWPLHSPRLPFAFEAFWAMELAIRMGMAAKQRVTLGTEATSWWRKEKSDTQSNSWE